MAFAVLEKPTGEKAAHRSARVMRLALVQAQSEVGTETFDPRDANMSHALESIDRAAKDEANVVVFGELYLTGYRTDEWLHKWATTVDPPDRHIQALIERARRHNLTILMGMATFGATMPGDVYNSTVVVTPTGLAGVYRKSHVAAFPYNNGDAVEVSMERCFYSPGKELPVFDTPAGRIGVHICYDMSFPEVARVQALKGADILINTSGSAGGFEEYWDHVAFTRAVENLTWYAVCSVVGVQRGTVLFGGSRVIDPGGNVLAHAKHNAEDYVVCDVDLDRARTVRSTSHTLSIRQPGLYSPIADPTIPT
jgi:predicted amidohydrolase